MKIQVEAWQTAPYKEGFVWGKEPEAPEDNPWGIGRAAELFNMGKEAATKYDSWSELKRAMIGD